MGRSGTTTARASPGRAPAGGSPSTAASRLPATPVPLPDPGGWPHVRGQLAAIVEHSNDAIFARTLDGTITTWNEAATRIFGWRAEEVIGRASRVLLPRGHRDEFRELMARIRRGEAVQHVETERVRKDRRRIHVSLTFSPIRDATNRLIGFSTIARDITEQRQTRDALQRRERELADLFEETSIGLLWTDRRGRILRANRAVLDLLECSHESCVGRRLAAFHPDQPVMDDVVRRLAERETLHNFQMVLRTRRRRAKTVLVDANAFWEEGRLIHTRWFIRDITRRKQLEREVLAISERERRAFSRELHDSLGQQLSGIAYLNNVVRDRLAEQGSAEAPEVARISKLLKQAIEETRRVSRGLSPVRPEPEGLDAALKELAAQTRGVFGIACHFRCTRPVRISEGEAATHLYRIAQEAVSNALRHGRARRVTIGLNQRHDQVVLSIADNGEGIGALSPKRKGLGLRVMQYRAGLLQGTLSVRRRPAGGTEVRCVAPASSLRAPEPSR